MHGPFEVGKQYRNRKGTYTVLQLNGDTMLLRYADGRQAKESVAHAGANLGEHPGRGSLR